MMKDETVNSGNNSGRRTISKLHVTFVLFGLCYNVIAQKVIVDQRKTYVRQVVAGRDYRISAPQFPV